MTDSITSLWCYNSGHVSTRTLSSPASHTNLTPKTSFLCSLLQWGNKHGLPQPTHSLECLDVIWTWLTLLQVLPSRRILFEENEWNALNISMAYLWIMQAFKCQLLMGKCVWNRYVLNGGLFCNLLIYNEYTHKIINKWLWVPKRRSPSYLMPLWIH